ncbi:MAG TPA: hypothetical protein VMT20_07520 [Terriglobia bacterium]|nr:hypothetical protein [Terriglobia bacterium]
MKLGERIRTPLVMLAAGLFLAFTASMRAQVQTTETTTHGEHTHSVSVERGEVVYVSGHEVIVKMDNGEIRDIANVPDSAKVTVDGNEIGIRDVKVGMKLQKTITTTTTPRMVTKVETVTGKVFQVMPPNSMILTLEDGTNQRFKIPADQKFNIDGQMVDAFHLKKGMNVSATRITETPETVVTQKAMLSGQMPPPPPPPPDAPVLIVYVPAAPAAAPAPAEAAEAAPAKLPKTASVVPLIGLAGALLLSLGLGLRGLRLTR